MKFFGYTITRDTERQPASPGVFIPLFGSLGIGPDGIRTSSVMGQARAYAVCSALMSVITKKSSAIKNMRLAAVDDSGEDVGRPEAVQRISAPNRFQDIAEFTAAAETMTSIFGKAYIAKIEAVGLESEFELFVVPNPFVMENTAPRTPGGFLFDPQAEVDSYTVSVGGWQTTIDRDHMFIVRDATFDMNAFGGSTSRLVSLEKQINTFMTAYGATHELMVNRGMLAIISLKSGKDILLDNTLPETKADKDEVYKALARYGTSVSQQKYAITSLDASVHPVSSTITDLGLSDVQKACKKDIADAYQVPSVLLDVEGSTYANAKEAKMILYNDAIIPDANNIFSVLNRIYAFDDFRVMPYYDHLELFQEAKRQQAAGMTNLVNALTNAVGSSLLTQEEARSELMKYIV